MLIDPILLIILQNCKETIFVIILIFLIYFLFFNSWKFKKAYTNAKNIEIYATKQF